MSSGHWGSLGILCAKILRGENTELTVQVRCKNGNQSFVERIRSLDGVNDAALIEFNGEYHG